jgi:hypothetical protein
MLAKGRETVAASDNDTRDESSRQKHHWSITSAWRYVLATIAALEKERRLPKPSAHAGDQRPAPENGSRDSNASQGNFRNGPLDK